MNELGGARFVVPGLRIGILTTECTECTEWGDSSNRSFRTVLTTDYTDTIRIETTEDGGRNIDHR